MLSRDLSKSQLCVKRSMRRVFAITAMTLLSVFVEGQAADVKLPTPSGLTRCPEDDPVISAEKRVAPSVGAEYVACFVSVDKTILHGTSKVLTLPVEHAIALTIAGGPYSTEDLDSLLSKVREQWKNFDPLGQAYDDYIAWFNSIISTPTGEQASIASEKPTLVSIDQVSDRAYSVVSIREYSVDIGGERVRSLKASAAAMALQGTGLVRLEMIRELRQPSDIAELRQQMALWCRATVGSSAR